MDLQMWVWLGAILVSAMTIFNFIEGRSKKGVIAEADMEQIKLSQREWNVRFDALYARFDMVERQTGERFERTQDKVNEALLTMAREHPTKTDLHELEARIINHIDMVALSSDEGRSRKRQRGQAD